MTKNQATKKLFDYHEIQLEGGGKALLLLPVPMPPIAKEALKNLIGALIDLAMTDDDAPAQ